MSTVRTFTVTGMTCEHCVRAVETEVGGIDGVNAVDVDLTSGAVTVASDREIPTEDLAEAVDEAGYEIAT